MHTHAHTRTRACVYPAGTVGSVSFRMISGTPWTWSCTSCNTTTSCATVAPNIISSGPPAQACSGTVQLITLSSSARGIGDGPGACAIGLSCPWAVNASGPITLRFNELQTAYLAHYITLYDGASTSDPLLSRFTGAIGQLSTAVRSASSRTDRRCDDDRLHLEQRLRFARRMRSLLKLIRNMSCAVGDFQIFPDIPPSFFASRAARLFGRVC